MGDRLLITGCTDDSGESPKRTIEKHLVKVYTGSVIYDRYTFLWRERYEEKESFTDTWLRWLGLKMAEGFEHFRGLVADVRQHHLSRLVRHLG